MFKRIDENYFIYEVWKKEPNIDNEGKPYPYCLVLSFKPCNNRDDIYNEMTEINRLFISPKKIGRVRALTGKEKRKELLYCLFNC